MRKLLFLCCFILILPVYAANLQQDEPDKESKAPCCFERAGYQGTCQVEPSEEETCESILKYLNTPRTVGKDYCGASKLRGGWESVDCPKQEESAL
jgi:hypothetical protein